MFSKASIVAIVVAGLLYFCLEGLWMGMVMAEHYAKAYEPFKAVMRAEADMNVWMWLVTTFLASAVLVWLARRSGQVTMKGTATIGAVMFGSFCFMMEFGMNQYFANYPFVPTSLITVAWEIVAGAITGAVAGMLYAKLDNA